MNADDIRTHALGIAPCAEEIEQMIRLTPGHPQSELPQRIWPVVDELGITEHWVPLSDWFAVEHLWLEERRKVERERGLREKAERHSHIWSCISAIGWLAAICAIEQLWWGR